MERQEHRLLRAPQKDLRIIFPGGIRMLILYRIMKQGLLVRYPQSMYATSRSHSQISQYVQGSTGSGTSRTMLLAQRLLYTSSLFGTPQRSRDMPYCETSFLCSIAAFTRPKELLRGLTVEQGC
jgi:hypothetical protein